MNAQLDPRPRAALARDAAARRLRYTTQISIAAIVALAGGFAALAAGSTHAKKATVRVQAHRPAKAVLAQAPAPPLVAVQSSAPAPAAPAAPESAPVPASEPPTVVSGGS